MTKYYLVKVVARKYEHSSIRGVLEALRGVESVHNYTWGVRLYWIGLYAAVFGYLGLAFMLWIDQMFRDFNLY